MKKVNLFTAMLLISTIAFAQFEGSYNFRIEQPESKKGRDGMEMKFTVKGDLATMEIVSGEMAGKMKKTILNRKDKTMIMLMENEGNKMAMKRKMHDFKPQDYQSKDSKPTITETGKTKVIDGYTCHEVLVENPESNVQLWYTSEIPITMFDVLSFASTARGPRGDGNSMQEYYWNKGVSLETTVIQKKDNNKTILHIEKIKKFTVPDSEFSTEGYQMMEMPQMGGMGYPGNR